MTDEQTEKVADIIGHIDLIKLSIGEIKRLMQDMPEELRKQVEYDMDFTDCAANEIRKCVEEWVTK